MPSLSYGFSYHNYADDTQLIYSFPSHHHTAMLLTVSCHYLIRPLIMDGDTWLKAESQQKMRCCILQEMIPYSHLQLEPTTKKHLIMSWSWQLKIHKTCLLISQLVSWLTRNRPVVSQISQDMHFRICKLFGWPFIFKVTQVLVYFVMASRVAMYFWSVFLHIWSGSYNYNTRRKGSGSSGVKVLDYSLQFDNWVKIVDC